MLFSFGLSVLLFASLTGTVWLWREDFVLLFPASRYSVLVGGALIGVAMLSARFRWRSLQLDERGFAWGLLVLFCSDWLTRSYNLLQGPSIRGEILLAALVTLWLLRAHGLRLLSLALPLTICLLVFSFLIESGGRLLFSDDNPTFMYRLSLLRENFPGIPFYNPVWNAGIEARDFFATGSLNVFFLFAPLIYLFGVFETYNYIVIGLLFLLLPSSVWAGSRLLGLPRISAALGALLALTPSLLWYRWALKYGTMGFVTSAALVPLNMALALRLLDPEREPRRIEYITAGITFTLMFFWSPAALVFIPALGLALRRVSLLKTRPGLRKLALFLLLVNGFWMFIFWNVSNVSSFLSSKTPSYEASADETSPAYVPPSTTQQHINTKEKSGSFEEKESIRILRETSVSTNPLLFMLAIPALFFLPREHRLFFTMTAGWLLLLGAVVAQLKPQLELDRMLVILSLALCVPVGHIVQRLLAQASEVQRWQNMIPALVVGGFLLTAPFSTASLLLNRSIEHFFFAQPQIDTLVKTIREESDGGRGLFSGFVLHDLYHGHVAPLPLLTGVPLIASSPFHDQWRYKDIFPRHIQAEGDAGIERFLNLMNATIVLAHEERWQQYYLERPDRYQLVLEDRRFHVFRRVGYESNYFLEGTGSVLSQDTRSLKVSLSSTTAVLKFQYFEFLKSSDCELSPEEALPGVRFIRLSNCNANAPITIEARGPIERLARKLL